MPKIQFVLIVSFVLLANGLSAAIFTSTGVTSNWNNATTWSLTSGTDSDGIPDANDNVIINNTVNSSPNASCFSMTINASGTLNTGSYNIYINGNFTNSGTVNISGTLWVLSGGGNFSSSVAIAPAGVWAVKFSTGVAGNRIITAGTNISMYYMILEGSGTVTNNGTVTLGTGNSTITTGTFINAAGASLTIKDNVPVSGGGALNASAPTNTVTFSGISATSVISATYDNLVLTNGAATTSSIKTLAGTITVNTAITIASNVQLNWAGNNINCNGAWTNNNSTNSMLNMGTITFGGASPNLLRRTNTEVFGNVVLNTTGTLTLNANNTALYTGAFRCTNLTFTSGTLDVNATANYSVSVTGNIISNGGILQPQQGTFNLNGTSAQTISGTGSLTFYNLTTSNAAGISVASSTIRISNIVTVSSGSFGTSGTGTIVIPATGATQYGRIGIVGGTLTGTGWRVDSYVNGPATAYWQYLSTPINGNTIADWDNDTRFYMSGVNGNEGNACCPTFYSVRVYSEATNTYSNITSTGHSIVRGRGYMVWMADNTSQLTAPLVYNSLGTPNFSSVTRAVTAGGAGGGYNLVGNPYACPIDYSSVVAASTASLDPSFVILQENGSYATDPNSGVIAPNQGFLCIANTGGNIVFEESCKNTTALPNILKTVQPQNQVEIYVNNNINGLGSQTIVRFVESASDNFEQGQDLLHLANVYDEADNIWCVTSDNKATLRTSTNANADKDIFVTVKSGVAGMHSLNFRGLSSVDAYNCIWLEDLESGVFTDLSLSQHYSFSSEHAGTERKFVVHFSNKSDCGNLKDKIHANSLEDNTLVYNNGNGIVVNFGFEEPTDAVISVYNVSGQLVSEPVSGRFTGESMQLNTPSAKQLFLVVIQSGEKRITRKIFN